MAQQESQKNGAEVLVVEDDPDVNELVGAYVKIAGFKYRRALDGSTALIEAAHRPPALILLDLMLPDLDGFEVCQRLTTGVATRSVPVVILSALDRDEHRRRGAECGATDYLTKPFDPDTLIATMRRVARRI